MKAILAGKRAGMKGTACASLLALLVIQFAPAGMALSCDTVSVAESAALPCHGETSPPEDPPCGFTLNPCRCCCVESAPLGSTDRGPVVPATQPDARAIGLVSERAATPDIEFRAPGAVAAGEVGSPLKTPLFVSHHALLI